ncbi:uncharacterized protein BDZ83DRAFT_646945 [Colletotrichum acutatum]|uniref:Uncharacterized protein n=1 Tax=Glomerella acutata TaxID=27357 RepID=A0AAD8XNM3_GLOAC|nr:uncharacterized protein BDZ83DRAFT_646945 [Colletotrichum acutatum]KAK1730617.1 hypothetical protein BDZ83DRAFT_646945 [Colletotrichum acutatum]
MTARSGGDLGSKALRISASTRYLTAATAADDSTTFGSGASPSSHPVHRIHPPCPVTSHSGLFYFPFPGKAFRHPVPDLSRDRVPKSLSHGSPLKFELRFAGSARAGTRVGLRILSSLSQLCAKLHRASAPSLRRWSETFTSAHARLILSRGTISHNGYRGIIRRVQRTADEHDEVCPQQSTRPSR